MNSDEKDEKMNFNRYHWSMTMEMGRLSERIAYALHLSCVTAHQPGLSNYSKLFFIKIKFKQNRPNRAVK